MSAFEAQLGRWKYETRALLELLEGEAQNEFASEQELLDLRAFLRALKLAQGAARFALVVGAEG